MSQSPPLSRRTPALLLVLLCGVVFGLVLASSLELTPSSSAAPMATEGRQAMDDGGVAQRVEADARNSIASFADLAEAMLPAVATIRATTIREGGQTQTGVGDDFFRRFFRGPDGQQIPGGPRVQPPRDRRDDGAGSGFVISRDGWVVTNNHVIDEATKVVVFLGDREYPAEIKGQDPSTDLAVLKIESDEDFAFLDLGESEELRIGDWVMAIGSPLGLGSSVTVGVVSAKGRSIGITGPDASFEDFIQTDAAINRGNSGGPLVNTSGQVVGISTAMNYGAENIGFAVPVDTLKRVLPQLQSEGRVRRGYLGVNIDDLTYRHMEAFGLESTRGALITNVMPGTPASKAGLEKGDVIVRVDEFEVEDNRDLINHVSSKAPGDRVDVEVIRNGKTVNKVVRLEERASTADIAEVTTPDEPEEMEWLGLQLQDLDDDAREELELESTLRGVLVTDVAASSPLYEERVQPYDVITEVNGEPVESAADFQEAVSAAESGKLLRLYLRSARARSGYFAIVRVP